MPIVPSVMVGMVRVMWCCSPKACWNCSTFRPPAMEMMVVRLGEASMDRYCSVMVPSIWGLAQ